MYSSLLMVLWLALGVGSGVTNRNDVTPVVGWDNQLFPSYILATSAMVEEGHQDPTVLGDRYGQLGCVVKASQENQAIKVTITGEPFLEASEFQGVLEKKGECYAIYPKVRYRFDKLSVHRQAAPATITFRVEMEGGEPLEVSKTATIRSLNDCPLSVARGDETIDTTFAFATYVNEQHPFVDKMLREALDRGIVDRFIGYQDHDPSTVIRQAYALWDLLVARDVRYSDITATAAMSQSVVGQHVRMIEETINNSQANCVDGSVLFVSMLRKIGVDAHLVLEPGHCYVCFYGDEAHSLLFGLETTLVDSECDEPEEVDELLDNAVAEERRGEVSWPSFVEALLGATGKMMSVAEASARDEEVDVKEGSSEGGSGASFTIINITSARGMGVLPIPYQGNDEFVAYDHTESQYGEGSESDGEGLGGEGEGESEEGYAN